MKLERKRAIVCSVKTIFGILSPYECESMQKYSRPKRRCHTTVKKSIFSGIQVSPWIIEQSRFRAKDDGPSVQVNLR